jgi:large subunit ribosomal protein L21
MYAVIRTGGKQYRVAKNDVIKIERLPGEAGQTVEFDEVLMVGGEQPLVGTPLVPGAKVLGTLLEQTRGPKIIVFKKKRRKNYKRRTGHRQDISVVRVTEIARPDAAGGDEHGAQESGR